MRTILVIGRFAVLATLAACSGAANSGTTTPQSTRLPEPTDPRIVLESQYAAYGARDANAFTAFYADDAFAFGPLAIDAYTNRSGARDAYAQAFDNQPERTMTSSGLSLHSVGPNCAWSFDKVEAGGPGQNPRQFFVTSILENDGGRWKIAAQSWSMPVRPTYILYRANRNEWPDIAAISESVGTGAEGARQQITEWLEDKTFRPVSGRTDSIVIAAWPNDERHGDEELVEALSQLREDESFLLSPIGGAHARTACDGQMAYVAFGQRVEMRSMNGPTIIVPTRGLAFFVNEGGQYRVMMIQASIGFPSYPQ